MDGSSAFDDLTLGEVEEISTIALGGRSFSSDGVDPLMLAGGVMWITKRRTSSGLTWEEFKATTKMSEIKSFSLDMEVANEMDPTNARTVPTS